MSPEGWGKAVGNAGFNDYQSSVEAEDGFEFLFTAKVPQTHPVTQYTSSEPVFLSYTFGQEILTPDATTPMQLWILAEDGIDGDFVMGLMTTTLTGRSTPLSSLPTSITTTERRPCWRAVTA